MKKDKIIKEYNEFNKEDIIIEMARLNDTNVPGIVINGYGTLNGTRSEHGLPHFDVKFKQITLGSFLIPKKSEWLESHDITFFKGKYEREAEKYKEYIIKWLETIDDDGISNIVFMRKSWNSLNAENTNCVFFDKNGEY